MRLILELRNVFARNRLLIAAISLTFFSVLIISAIVVYAAFLTSPALIEKLRGLLSSTRSYVAIPPPYTKGLYGFIFLNNIGHFWNPVRIWVWIPLIGVFSLGFELIFNAIVIGGIAAFFSLTKGAMFAVAGLAPHGVIELPAFMLEFGGLARWHITTTRALYTKLSGRNIDGGQLREGIKDTVVLSAISVLLFAVAAYVETFITPRFLGL